MARDNQTGILPDALEVLSAMLAAAVVCHTPLGLFENHTVN